jgi:phage gp46-like protein
MTDIRIAQQGSAFEAVTLDLLLTPMGELDTTQELATAVTVALLTDALAGPDDVLPDQGTDRRGWWGDLDANELWDGWPIGSKLWLFARAKITPRQAREGSTTARIEAYIREALQPFLDRKIASRLDVSVTRVGTERIEAAIVLYRGPRQAVELRFASLWDGILVSAPTS